MKKFVVIFIIAVLLGGCRIAMQTESGTRQNERLARETATASATAVQVPQLQHFPERKTIARWATTFDVPEITCYIYLINYGNIIGYYVTNGKPASTQSYLTPSMEYAPGGSTGSRDKELPDIDGCYGENQPGVRFFTASGVAVEWGGSGATYLFSTQKLPINVPELGR